MAVVFKLSNNKLARGPNLHWIKPVAHFLQENVTAKDAKSAKEFWRRMDAD